MPYGLNQFWRRLNLAQRFALASLVVIVASMTVVGWWIDREIESGVTRRTGVTTALYVSSFVAPHVQELAREGHLSERSVAVLQGLLRDTPLGERIVSLKVWGPDARIVYASEPSLIGKVFPPTQGLETAWSGNVATEFSQLGEEEDVLERKIGVPLLETYSPVYETGGKRIIAVVEFYELASDLNRQLSEARLRTWLVVAVATLFIFGLLFGIVRQGSRTIVSQRSELQKRVEDLSALLAKNRELRHRVSEASNRAAELNESWLRRVSSELHDGPAQGIGFALLRFDALKAQISGKRGGRGSDTTDLDRIRNSLQDALQEIRNLCSGIALPELDDLSLKQAIGRAVRAHERKTDSRVELYVGPVPDDVAPPLKIGIYRFLQEALNNAFRHGRGKGQQVNIGLQGSEIAVEVIDQGPGFDPCVTGETNGRLGIVGMRKRAESFGGSFYVESSPGQGTRVRASFPLKALEAEHV